jgi:hypothetical protein
MHYLLSTKDTGGAAALYFISLGETTGNFEVLIWKTTLCNVGDFIFSALSVSPVS